MQNPLIHNLVVNGEDGRLCECANCDWQGAANRTVYIADFFDRVAPGEPCPVGECPECGALTHWLKEGATVEQTAIKIATARCFNGWPWSSSDMNVDDDTKTSAGEDGVWVRAWVHVAYEDIKEERS